MWLFNIRRLLTQRQSLSSVMTLSKDYAVCWSIDKDNITFSDSESESESNSGVADSIFAAVTPWNANEVPVKEINVTFAAVKDFTRRGVYTIPVKISTDGGSTWTDEKALKFSAGKISGNNQQNNLNSGSSGGCDLGLGALGLCFALLALVLGRKS